MVQKVDLETALPAILEAAATYRAACDDFNVKLDAARESLTAAAATLVSAVEMGRQIGLDVGDPFNITDPIGKALGQIRLAQYPIRLSCEI